MLARGACSRLQYDRRSQQRRTLVREILTYMVNTYLTVAVTNRYLLTGAKPHVRNLFPELHAIGRQYEQVWLDT